MFVIPRADCPVCAKQLSRWGAFCSPKHCNHCGVKLEHVPLFSKTISSIGMVVGSLIGVAMIILSLFYYGSISERGPIPLLLIGGAFLGYILLPLILSPYGNRFEVDDPKAFPRCPRCGYDLRGSQAGCPECGLELSPRAINTK
jgi:hypothetical protein